MAMERPVTVIKTIQKIEMDLVDKRHQIHELLHGERGAKRLTTVDLELGAQETVHP